MTASDITQRARTAREFYQVALERLDMAPDGPSEAAQVAASNAVHAAIAAADALCGRAHGYHASGSDHREAVRLVTSIPEVGPRLSGKLRGLLSDKTNLTYGGFCTRVRARQAADAAKVLIEELDRISL